MAVLTVRALRPTLARVRLDFPEHSATSVCSHVCISFHRIGLNVMISAICLAGCRQGTCDGKPNTCSCNPGWEGTLCDQPICKPRCVQGVCVESTQYNRTSLMFVHQCACNQGWTGTTCSTRLYCLSLIYLWWSLIYFAMVAICAAGCLTGRGTCIIPDGCDCTQQWSGALCNVCNSGWTGANCDTR